MNDAVANKNPKATPRARLRESFVLVAMSLVAVAVGVGLYAQFEVGFVLAILVACLGYVGFLALHLLVGRAQEVLALEADVARLSARVAEFQLALERRRDNAPDLDAQPARRFVRTARPPMRQGEQPTEAAGSSSEPKGSPPQPPALSISGYPSLSSGNGFAPDGSSSRVVMPSPTVIAKAGSDVLPETSADVALAAGVDDVSEVQAPQKVALIAPSGAISGPPSEQEHDPGSEKLGDSPTLSAKSADTREFESMQVIIRQLAERLNAPEQDVEAAAATESPTASAEDDERAPASPDTQAHRVAAATDQAIEQSAALLRSAAGDLRRIDASVQMPERVSPTFAEALGDSLEVVGSALPAPHRPPSPYGRLALIAEAIEAERIDVYLDPIMGLDERRAKHFEVSVRLRTDDHHELEAQDFRPIAAEAGLLAQIDSAKLARTAKVAERLRARGSTGSLFSSFDGGSLGDVGFRETVSGLFADGAPPDGRLVLAFAQGDVRAFTGAHWGEITTMKALGLRFSLEGVTDLDMDFEQMVASGFEFIKLDAKVFLEGLPAPGGAIPASDLCRHMSGMGLTLVVGRIAEEQDLAAIVGFGAVLGQGMLFGASRPVKVDMVAAQAAA